MEEIQTLGKESENSFKSHQALEVASSPKFCGLYVWISGYYDEAAVQPPDKKNGNINGLIINLKMSQVPGYELPGVW